MALLLPVSVSDYEPEVGSTVTFTLKVENLGSDTANSIVVTDLLPAGFTYVAGTIAGGTTEDDSGAPNLAWTINSLNNGAMTTVTFVATVNSLLVTDACM